eukprot:scaffold9821_cov47-Attheya_sp.AAC.1
MDDDASSSAETYHTSNMTRKQKNATMSGIDPLHDPPNEAPRVDPFLFVGRALTAAAQAKIGVAINFLVLIKTSNLSNDIFQFYVTPNRHSMNIVGNIIKQILDDSFREIVQNFTNKVCDSTALNEITQLVNRFRTDQEVMNESIVELLPSNEQEDENRPEVEREVPCNIQHRVGDEDDFSSMGGGIFGVDNLLPVPSAPIPNVVSVVDMILTDENNRRSMVDGIRGAKHIFDQGFPDFALILLEAVLNPCFDKIYPDFMNALSSMEVQEMSDIASRFANHTGLNADSSVQSSVLAAVPEQLSHPQAQNSLETRDEDRKPAAKRRRHDDDSKG